MKNLNDPYMNSRTSYINYYINMNLIAIVTYWNAYIIQCSHIGYIREH